MNEPRVTYETTCKCGQKVAVVQDRDDPSKFHFECHACGASNTVTRIREGE
jgi:hypothetical protein